MTMERYYAVYNWRKQTCRRRFKAIAAAADFLYRGEMKGELSAVRIESSTGRLVANIYDQPNYKLLQELAHSGI